MAHDWIKMRTNLADDPAVIGIAAAVRLDRHSVVGRLHTLWSWADAHTTTGHLPNITPAFIDEKAARKGFAAAMATVHWLVIDPTGVTFPHFDRHNGESAKKRAIETDKKRHQRSGQNHDTPPAHVPHHAGQNHDKPGTEPGTREEKRIQQQQPRRILNPISDFPTLALEFPGVDLHTELEKARVYVRTQRGPKADVEYEFFRDTWLPKSPVTRTDLTAGVAPPGFAAWFDQKYPEATPEARAEYVTGPWKNVPATLRAEFQNHLKSP